MTVYSSTRKAGPFDGNGSTTAFPFGFKVSDKTDLALYKIDASGGVSDLTLDSDYSVTLNPDQSQLPGGTINYPVFGSPLASGFKLVALGATPLTQETDITNQGGFYPEIIEAMVDRATMQIQQLAETLSRAIVVAPSGDATTPLPDSATRANTVIAFDANGNLVTVTLPASVGAGDMRDEIGSDGKAGLIIGTDIAVGATQVTLSRAPGNAANVFMSFDSAYQGNDNIQSIVGNVLTLTSGIPAGFARFYIRTGTTLSLNLPAQQSVTDDSVAPGTKVYNRGNDTVCITDFGAVQALDASAALIAAANFCALRGGGKVLIPAGTWKIAAPAPQFANVEFIGEGRGVTILQPTSAITLFSLAFATETVAYVAVRNLTINAAVAGVKGISWTLCRFTEIENVDFVGCTGNNFEIDRGLGHTVSNVTSAGKTGLAAGGAKMFSSIDSTDTGYISHATIHNYKLIDQGTGSPSQGLYLRRAIDFQINDMHAYGAFGCTVLVIENDSQAVKVKGLNIDGCAAGALLQQGTGVAVVPTFTDFTACHIDQPTAYGIQANGAQFTTFNGVMFTPRGGYTNIPALYLVGDLNSKVEACRMYGFSTSGGAAIQLNASNNLTVRNTDVPQCYVGVGFSGVCQNVDIEMDFTNCANPIGGSPVGTSNRIRPGLKGLVPSTTLVPTSPSMPASGVAYTNNTAFTCRVSIMGGTFTAVAVNGISTGVSNNNWTGEIQPGETIALTYSAAPSWWWIGK